MEHALLKASTDSVPQRESIPLAALLCQPQFEAQADTIMAMHAHRKVCICHVLPSL